MVGGTHYYVENVMTRTVSDVLAGAKAEPVEKEVSQTEAASSALHFPPTLTLRDIENMSGEELYSTLQQSVQDFVYRGRPDSRAVLLCPGSTRLRQGVSIPRTSARFEGEMPIIAK